LSVNDRQACEAFFNQIKPLLNTPMSRPSSATGGPGGRSSTPTATARNLANLRKAQMTGPRSHDNVLASLRATQINVTSKPLLPAELIATILDYLPVPDLARCARVSRRLQEMVYDDTRWIQKLKAMGAWSDAEARQRFEEGRRRKADAHRTDEAKRTGSHLPSDTDGQGGRAHAESVTLFDAGLEEERYKSSQDQTRSPVHRRRETLTDGFSEVPASPTVSSGGLNTQQDPAVALTVFTKVRSIRGHARQEFGRIYAALGPFYNNLVKSRNQSDSMIFRTYRDPEQQAQILSQLKRFAQSDHTEGWAGREAKLDATISAFEHAVLREFQQGLAANDVEGRMRRYAHVLVAANGGVAGVDAYINSILESNEMKRLGSLLDCLESVAPGHVDLNPSQRFFERLAEVMVDQASIVDSVFPPTVDVLTPLLGRFCDGPVSDSLTALFDEAHSQGAETYVKAVSGTFEQSLRFAASIQPSKASPPDFVESARSTVVQCFERHVDLYLTEELSFFKMKSNDDVGRWEKELSEQQANAESFFMSNVQRQAAKRDFLSSFKKVVMMPVTAFPSRASKPAPAQAAAITESTSRPMTPGLGGTSTPQVEPPTTELAAKAAIMNNRLEGIKSLFSIEVALELTHLAKASIERAAIMVNVGGKQGSAAKEQCEAVFVELLDILGNRHVRPGFDKAVEHLGNYNPRQVREYRAQGQDPSSTEATGVEPLVTFLELVNVGDLIQQMIDVFYSQEMVATKLTDRDDFLNQAVKEKKRFEQMLDERVAAGLNKGIDVLMDEVEYICATTQQPTDFNPAPPPNSSGSSAIPNIDPTPTSTAHQVIATISGHTGMLLGSTDKTTLDVFLQEVGLRLFTLLCKHIKRQRISSPAQTGGAIKLIADLNLYANFISSSLRQKSLGPYYAALRELGQIYLVAIDPPASSFFSSGGTSTTATSATSGGGSAGADPTKNKRTSTFANLLSSKASTTSLQAKELATIIADTQRYRGIFPAEEVYEFAERRADWYLVRADVERAMYGVGCAVM
jgi:recyclin-1